MAKTSTDPTVRPKSRPAVRGTADAASGLYPTPPGVQRSLVRLIPTVKCFSVRRAEGNSTPGVACFGRIDRCNFRVNLLRGCGRVADGSARRDYESSRRRT